VERERAGKAVDSVFASFEEDGERRKRRERRERKREREALRKQPRDFLSPLLILPPF
jgi:hypothetical protein